MAGILHPYMMGAGQGLLGPQTPAATMSTPQSGGLLSMFMPEVGQNRFYQGFDRNRDTLSNAFFGMVGQDGPRGAARGFAQGAMYGRESDRVLQEQRKKQDEAQRTKNSTIEWLTKSRPDLAEAVAAGMPVNEAFNQAFAQPKSTATDDIKEYQYAVQNGMFNGSFTDWQTKGIRDQDPTFGRERDTRKDYEGQDNVKNYTKVRDSYQRIRAAAQTDSGPGDIGLIFNYMKMLDPGSVVREGEFATAANAGGVGQQIINLYNQMLTGERLTPELRMQFIDAADKLYGEAVGNLERTNQRYSGVAQEWGLDPSRIVMEPDRYEPLKLGDKPKQVAPGVTIQRVE